MRYNPAYKIGITGSVCSGKSAVRHSLRHFGVSTLDVEDIGMQLLLDQPNRLSIRLSDHFGTEVLDLRGRLSPGKLRGVLNAQPERKGSLNELLSPVLREEVKRFLYGPAGGRLRAVESTYLLEMNMAHLFDEIWLVNAPPELRIKRLMARNHLEAVNAQRVLDVDGGLSEAEKQSMCQREFLNTGDGRALDKQIEDALEQIRLKMRVLQ